MAVRLNLAEKFIDEIDEFLLATTKFWSTVDHSKNDFVSNDTIILTREGDVEWKNARSNGTIPTTVKAQAIIHGFNNTTPTSGDYYDAGSNNLDRADYIAMEQYKKTLTQEKKFTARFELMQLGGNGYSNLSGLKNELTKFIARQTAATGRMYDQYGLSIVKSNIPAANLVTVAATDNLWDKFSELNNLIKNATVHDPNGKPLPLAGSGKKIGLCSSKWITRFIKDLKDVGAAGTQNQDMRLINGYVTTILKWDLIECEDFYLPYVTGSTGAKVDFIGYDPSVISAPLVVDRIITDTSETLDIGAHFVSGHCFYDTFIKNNPTRQAGRNDREQLLGGMVLAAA